MPPTILPRPTTRRTLAPKYPSPAPTTAADLPNTPLSSSLLYDPNNRLLPTPTKLQPHTLNARRNRPELSFEPLEPPYSPARPQVWHIVYPISDAQLADADSTLWESAAERLAFERLMELLDKAEREGQAALEAGAALDEKTARMERAVREAMVAAEEKAVARQGYFMVDMGVAEEDEEMSPWPILRPVEEVARERLIELLERVAAENRAVVEGRVAVEENVVPKEVESWTRTSGEWGGGYEVAAEDKEATDDKVASEAGAAPEDGAAPEKVTAPGDKSTASDRVAPEEEYFLVRMMAGEKDTVAPLAADLGAELIAKLDSGDAVAPPAPPAPPVLPAQTAPTFVSVGTQTVILVSKATQTDPVQGPLRKPRGWSASRAARAAPPPPPTSSTPAASHPPPTPLETAPPAEAHAPARLRSRGWRRLRGALGATGFALMVVLLARMGMHAKGEEDPEWWKKWDAGQVG